MLKNFFAFPGQFKACAGCIPDGANLTLYRISSKLQEAHGLGSTAIVTVRQLSEEPRVIATLLSSETGVRVGLQELEDGQRVKVLTLSSGEAEVLVEMMTDVFG